MNKLLLVGQGRLTRRVNLAMGIHVIIALMMSATIHARPLDDLLYDATRYANTPARKEAKQAARAELKDRMPDAFHAAMQYIHGDHVGLNVLVMEWVQELPEEVVVPALLDYIDHEREETRRIAIFFLGFKDTPEHAERILPHLENDLTRASSLRTLGKWRFAGARGVAEKTLADGQERQRVVAANTLRDLGDPAALPSLLNALDDPVFTVRHTAARAIVSLGEAAVAPLQAAQAESTTAARRLIDRGLADLGEITVASVLGKETIHLEAPFFP